MNRIGISGITTYVPSYRVDLENWCAWTGGNWNKIKTVVGHSFRLPGANENMYTMAANAVLKLIKNYNIDPREVGFLGLGTETSTDNAAGAIIVKGIVNQGLKALGLPLLARDCEVPEYKQACLGGVYAMKGAIRYLAVDGSGKKAITVCSDIAKYERNTAGEPTQGAGAVALLIEEDAKLLEVDLSSTGRASDYRILDFRKPFSRFMGQKEKQLGQVNDFPVLNGQYSTVCYIDEVLAALKDFARKKNDTLASYIQKLSNVFLHRPYAQMAETGWLMCNLYALSQGTEEDKAILEEYCEKSSVSYEDVIKELSGDHDFLELVEQKRLNNMVYSKTQRVIRMISRNEELYNQMFDPLSLGWDMMKEVGNVYTSSLFMWIASACETAARDNLDLTDKDILTVGYGSGDAAEIIPMTFMPTWKDASEKIGFENAFETYTDLNEEQYQYLHSGEGIHNERIITKHDFFIKDIGVSEEKSFNDKGIEYYDFAVSAS